MNTKRFLQWFQLILLVTTIVIATRLTLYALTNHLNPYTEMVMMIGSVILLIRLMWQWRG